MYNLASMLAPTSGRLNARQPNPVKLFCTVLVAIALAYAVNRFVGHDMFGVRIGFTNDRPADSGDNSTSQTQQPPDSSSSSDDESSSNSGPSSSSGTGPESTGKSSTSPFTIELHASPHKKRYKKNYVVSHLQLVMAWPPGVCNETGKCWAEVEMTRFHIHGLWPAEPQGRTKTNCPVNYKPGDFLLAFQTLGVAMIHRLHRHWPTYQINRQSSLTRLDDSLKFWEHEYEIHGSCAMPSLNFEEYFRAVLEKGGSTKVENWLAGMIAQTRTSYDWNEFATALFPYIGGNHFYLRCLPTPLEPNRLKEIVFCLDLHSREFISCPPNNQLHACTVGSPVTIHKRWTFE